MRSPAIGSTTMRVPSAASATERRAGRAVRVAHVVQAVEHRDQVGAARGQVAGVGHLEA